jgi:hypothetical protein
MARKIYKRIGLRRDNNLSDLSNSTAALNNLLDGLTDVQGFTFVSDDLNAIRNIDSAGLRNAEYRNIVGSAVRFSDSSGVPGPFFPKITYQNRLDIAKSFSGEPRLSGGGGLTANYFNPNQINQNSIGIFSGSPFKIDNYWESGNFPYTGKITPESLNSNGGVLWEGYFIPTQTGSYSFYISSSACFTFDFQTEGYISGVGTYTEIARIGITTTFSGSGTGGTNIISLGTTSNIKYVGVGQSVSASGIATGSNVKSYNISNGVIELTPPIGINTAVSTTFSGNIIFFKTIGQSTQISHSTYVLEEYQKYRIRARYFIPESIDAINAQRNITFSFTRPADNSAGLLRYNNLYALDYDFSESAKGEFPIYIDNSIRFGGGTIGGSGDSNSYVKVKSTKKVDILYTPKTNLGDITKATTSATTVSSSFVISIPNTSNIEVGNYVFGTNIQENTRVNQIVIGKAIVLDKSATGTGSVTLTFIDHRGFVKRAVGSINGTTLTLSSGNTNTLKTGMVVIGTNVTQYTGITTTSSASEVTVSPAADPAVGAGTTLFFYQSRGLINNGLAGYCLPDQTKCLIVTADTNAGSTTIPVNDSTGVGNGWVVQGFQFEPGTIVSGAPATSTSITINAPTTRNLVAGANFTVTNAGGDRSLCCPPTDTSPPFNPTTEGLDTVAEAPNLKIESGNIIFDALKAVVDVGNITNYNKSDVSKNRISIQTSKGEFTILCQ